MNAPAPAKRIVTPHRATATAQDAAPGPRWRLLMTRPRQEARVVSHLQRLGLPHRAPQWQAERITRGRRHTKTEWLFPRYVFVQVDFAHTPFNYLKYLAGVTGFVRCAHQLVDVAPPLIASLDAAANQPQPHPPQPAIAPGAQVLLNGGAYQDVPAVYLQQNGETRSRVMLSWLGRSIETNIHNRYLSLA